MSIAFSHCTCYRSPEILKILYQVLGSKMSSNANVPTPALVLLSTCPHPKEPAFTDGCFFFSIQWCSAVNTFKDFPILILYNTFNGFPIVVLSNTFKDYPLQILNNTFKDFQILVLYNTFKDLKMGAPPTLPQAGSCPACPTCVSSSYLASFSLHSTKSNNSKGTALVLLQKVLLKYSRHTCVSSSYLASLSLHSTTTPKIL